MKIFWVTVGGLGGLVIGGIVGFGIALTLSKPRTDGSFAMREILVGLPSGALLGLVVGVWLILRRLG